VLTSDIATGAISERNFNLKMKHTRWTGAGFLMYEFCIEYALALH